MSNHDFASSVSQLLAETPVSRGNLLDWAGKVGGGIKLLLSLFGLPDKEKVLEIVETEVQKVFDAVDIPVLPDGPEQLLEQAVMTALLQFIGDQYDKLAAK